MHSWLISPCLVLICFTSSVRSQKCHSDYDCNDDERCCTGIGVCAARFTSRCQKCSYDGDCYNWEECYSGICRDRPFPTYPVFTAPTYNPSNDHCLWDSDCSGGLVCEDRLCVHEDTGGFSWSGSKVAGVVFFVVVCTVISCFYHMCKRARQRRVPSTQNAQPTVRPAGSEATNTTHATGVEMEPRSATSNSATVIDVEENSPPMPPLPVHGPPPYSSLEFQRQGNDNDDEPEQPPPSYDEAVRNSSMALV